MSLTSVVLTWSVPPASGYHRSILEVPGIPVALGLLTASYSLAIISTILGGPGQEEVSRKPPWVGLGICALNLVVIILMPVATGYVFYSRFDGLSHMGYAQDIFQTGRIAIDNFYPATHILVVQAVYVTDLAPFTTGGIVPALFLLVYTASIYVLVRRFLAKRGKVSLVILTTLTPVALLYPSSLSPFSFALLMLPLALYAYFARIKGGSWGFVAMFVPVTFVIIFLHILVAFFLAFILLVTAMYIARSGRSIEPKVTRKLDENSPSLGFLAIVLTTSIAWFSSSVLWAGSVTRVARWIAGEATSAPVASASALSLSLDTLELVSLVLRVYGSLLVVGVVALCGTIAVASKRVELSSEENFLCVLLLWTSALSIVLFAILPTGLDYNRPFRFLLLPLLLFSGVVLRAFLRADCGHPSFRVALVSGIMITASIAGIAVIHPSDYGMQQNPQLTVAELTGLQWFLSWKDPSTYTVGITNKLSIADAILGHSRASGRDDIPPAYDERSYVGDHFEKVVASGTPSFQYLIISQYDRSLYTETWKVTARFDWSDFLMLDQLLHVSKVYSNGDTDIYLVSPTYVWAGL